MVPCSSSPRRKVETPDEGEEEDEPNEKEPTTEESGLEWLALFHRRQTTSLAEPRGGVSMYLHWDSDSVCLRACLLARVCLCSGRFGREATSLFTYCIPICLCNYVTLEQHCEHHRIFLAKQCREGGMIPSKDIDWLGELKAVFAMRLMIVLLVLSLILSLRSCLLPQSRKTTLECLSLQGTSTLSNLGALLNVLNSKY